VCIHTHKCNHTYAQTLADVVCNARLRGDNVSIQVHLLQCVAVCCSVLQCVAVCCSVLQCVAVCCSVLQYVAVFCTVQRPHPQQRPVNTGTFSAVWYFVLQCVVAVCCSGVHCATPASAATTCLYWYICCSVLQCVVAVCCSVVHYATPASVAPMCQYRYVCCSVAVRCSVLLLCVAVLCTVQHPHLPQQRVNSGTFVAVWYFMWQCVVAVCCCCVLQCVVAVCCSVLLLCVAVVCIVQRPHPQHQCVNTGTFVAVWRSVLQCVVALCCSVVHCATPASAATTCPYRYVCCSVVLCASVCCRCVLQCCALCNTRIRGNNVSIQVRLLQCCSVFFAVCCSVVYCATPASAVTMCQYRYVCCSVVQCVALCCCFVLQCCAVCTSHIRGINVSIQVRLLQCGTVCFSVLLLCVAVVCSVHLLHPWQQCFNTSTCVAVCCSVLQCVAVCCCSVLQCCAVCNTRIRADNTSIQVHVLQCVAVCCSVLQCCAVCG